MDKEAFFSALKLKESTVKVPGTDMDITLRELNAGQREEIMRLSKDRGFHYMAAVTVAQSCPDFDDTDIDRLLKEVKPEALLSLSTQVYDMSALSEGSSKEAKKP